MLEIFPENFCVFIDTEIRTEDLRPIQAPIGPRWTAAFPCCIEALRASRWSTQN